MPTKSNLGALTGQVGSGSGVSSKREFFQEQTYKWEVKRENKPTFFFYRKVVLLSALHMHKGNKTSWKFPLKVRRKKTSKKSKYHCPSPASALNQMEFPSKKSRHRLWGNCNHVNGSTCLSGKTSRAFTCYTPLTLKIRPYSKMKT